MKKLGFTLIETIIVLVIVGILSTLLTQTYIQMSKISFRVEQEKNVTQEVLLLSEVLQNYADRNSLDFEKYKKEKGILYLKNQRGLVDTLYLSGLDGNITITSNGSNCIEPGENMILEKNNEKIIQSGDCKIIITQNDKTFEITNPKKVKMTKLWFKIIPYAKYDDYFEKNNEKMCETNYLVCPNKPGFWLLGKAYNINYGTQWSNHIILPIQQFFNLQ